ALSPWRNPEDPVPARDALTGMRRRRRAGMVRHPASKNRARHLIYLIKFQARVWICPRICPQTAGAREPFGNGASVAKIRNCSDLATQRAFGILGERPNCWDVATTRTGTVGHDANGLGLS